MKWSSGCSSELRNHEEQQHETCCNASTLAMCENAGAGIVEISPVPGAGDLLPPSVIPRSSL
ncbi:hypothetical protein ABR759_09330 [Escherichia coli]